MFETLKVYHGNTPPSTKPHLLILSEQLGTKYLNIWVYRGHFNSNYYIDMQPFIKFETMAKGLSHNPIVSCEEPGPARRGFRLRILLRTQACAQNFQCIISYLTHTGTVMEMGQAISPKHRTHSWVPLHREMQRKKIVLWLMCAPKLWYMRTSTYYWQGY